MSADPAKARALCDEAIAKALEYGADFKTGKWEGQKDGKVPDGWTKWAKEFQSRMDEDLAAEVWELWEKERTRDNALPVEMKSENEQLVFEWTVDEDIEVTSKGINILHYPRKGDPEVTPIIGGLIKPLGRALVDGDELIEFVYDGGYTAVTLPEMIKLLKDRGSIFDRRADGVLSFVVSQMATTSRIVHSCYGIYDDIRPPRLTLNYDVHPKTDDQKLACQQISKNFSFRPWKHRYMDSYEEFNDLFKPFEVRPIIGAQIMANFNEILRCQGLLCPDIYDWSIHSDTGKTDKAKAYTTLLYGMLAVDGETIESTYRTGSLRSAYNGVVAINEVETIKPKIWSGMKTAPESVIALRRGTPSQGMNTYYSRATFNYTANRLMIHRPDVLKRIIVVHSTDDDSELQMRWRHKDKFDALMNCLKPMGFRLLEELLARNRVFQTRETLLQEIAKNSLVIRKIAQVDEHPLMSSRSDIWGLNFTGNQAWDWLCEICDTPHESLSPDEFYKLVVKPNETSTFESAHDPVEVFLEWFSGWRTRHTKSRRSYDNAGYVETEYVLGQDADFVSEQLPVPCYYVTDTILEEYNKDRQDYQFGSLKSLAVQAADYAGVDSADVLSKDGYPKVIKMNTVPRRAAFVPKDPTPHRKVVPKTKSEDEDGDGLEEEE